jgi:hypothetical protein
MAALTRIAEHECDRLLKCIGSVEIASRSIHVLCKTEGLLEPGEGTGRGLERLSPLLPGGDRLLIENDDCLRLIIDVPPHVRGRIVPLKVSGIAGEEEPNPSTVETLRRAHRRLIQLNASPLTPEAHSSAQAPIEGWTRNGLALAFLAPEIQKAILRGELSITGKAALATSLPLAWADQRRILTRRLGSG